MTHLHGNGVACLAAVALLGALSGAQQSLAWARKDLITEHSGVAMAEDVARGRIVIFGSAGFAAPLNETLEWDGVSWTLRAPGVSPSARSASAMMHDSARQRVVLFGGA